MKRRSRDEDSLVELDLSNFKTYDLAVGLVRAPDASQQYDRMIDQVRGGLWREKPAALQFPQGGLDK